MDKKIKQGYASSSVKSCHKLKVGTVCNGAGLLLHKRKDDSAQRRLLLLFTGRCCEMGLGALEMFF